MKQETKREITNFLDEFNNLAYLVLLGIGVYYSIWEKNFLGFLGFVIATMFFAFWKIKKVEVIKCK